MIIEIVSQNKKLQVQQKHTKTKHKRLVVHNGYYPSTGLILLYLTEHNNNKKIDLVLITDCSKQSNPSVRNIRLQFVPKENY